MKKECREKNAIVPLRKLTETEIEQNTGRRSSNYEQLFESKNKTEIEWNNNLTPEKSNNEKEMVEDYHSPKFGIPSRVRMIVLVVYLYFNQT